MQRIRVLIIDDSLLFRRLLTEIINGEHDMEVIGTASDPLVAREMIRDMNPDVLTLDVEMPRMNGLDFLEKLMRLRPMPVVMVSAFTEKNSGIALQALKLGAVDFIAKSKIVSGLKQGASEVTDKVRFAMTAWHKWSRGSSGTGYTANRALSMIPNRTISTEKLVVMGASVGGTEAIREFLINLSPNFPGILIAQHMPATFTGMFARRLNNLCQISVMEAKGGERILPGHAFLAPGHSHLLLRRTGTHYVTVLSQDEPVNRHRPSVDVLFRSAARVAGKNAIGVILTGMGKDGAAGMLEMHQAGAYNLAQDEASCVVFGMPKAAIALGAADEVVPLRNMARRILSRISRVNKNNT
ncbi:response regulator receiver modulated CheB methylesterase [Nitrosomonas cryotolerans]|uniref:Protein-glutamate methylesterase/protein-glutamine glutaminase n=1 Tax=Nitrosomonas cryotolerans ATCC 49181 TaxID=1131553 RepID=A0A1N6I6T7_9PROT|nr:chemotaxis response regulator protein-glutamate methylesterase [Nitrosomonas cryotolerans]SFP91067.1 response regulator receiver modulated CheB methylesterase [Nitrosomonas cryotolerans]SIO27724.1 two-component system, chemotaxis family, response regulator CheB [Nitrosomonas cryotolerans ATCC 49181]